MINYYQPFLLPFLRAQTYRLPEGISRTYFVSFEDALWVLLRTRNIPKNSVILIPNFYCMDVVRNIKAHGYRIEYYPLDDHFQITEKELQRYVTAHRPRLLIIFHACGITSSAKDAIGRILAGDRKLIVVEDAVHRFINPHTVSLASARHYCIDSLRKVSPLPGSFLYRRSDSPPIKPDPMRREWSYVLLSLAYYALFFACNTLGTMIANPSLIVYAHTTILRKHDDLIGDSIGGYAGNPIFSRIHRHSNFESVEQMKEAQVSRYEALLAPLISRYSLWYTIRIPQNSRKHLHAFPIGLKHPQLSPVMDAIQSALIGLGIPVWFKFPDSPWSNKRGALFLPLGFHMRQTDILRVIAALEKVSRQLPTHSLPRY